MILDNNLKRPTFDKTRLSESTFRKSNDSFGPKSSNQPMSKTGKTQEINLLQKRV